ncbi:hypothetical protein B0H14DRAFT_3457588 [Mycena olivaceomarginata]|nr:hypothetical protein B0H14DRAFT_3457588 [Mycena olivaceomarginata]
MSFVHDWGIPGIDIPVPPARGSPSRETLAFRNLRFSPLGLYDLRRRLGVYPGEPGVFQRFRNRFLTSDIAWFAGGASTDNKHVPPTPGFFPEFTTLRETLPTGPVGNEARKVLNERMQHAIFDLATLWDRTFGGTTMIMHVEGTTMPNTPTEPQFLRAATHAAIARIAQTFIEAVGVPTVQQWRANALLHGWSLTQPGPGASPNGTTPYLIPPPPPGSAHFKFFGRPVGALDTLLGTAPPPPSLPVIVIPDDEDDGYFDDVSTDLMDATTRAHYAEAQSAERLEQIQTLERQPPQTPSGSTWKGSYLPPDIHVLRRPLHPVDPSRAHVPAPFPALNPRSPLAAGYANDNQPDGRLDGLDLFIRQENLQHLVIAIKVVIRAYAPVKWYEELLALGINGAVVSRLVDVAVVPA